MAMFQKTMNGLLNTSPQQASTSFFKCSHCSHDNCAISALKGAMNGFFYGSRLRFAHAFVMGILFGKGTLTERVKWAFKMALNHGFFLTLLVASYKISQCVLVRVLKRNNPAIGLAAGAISSRIVSYNFNREFVAVLK